MSVLNGMTVGVVGNRTERYDEDGNVAEKYADVLTARGARKAAKFVKFCDAFEIPVLTPYQCKRLQGDTHSERCIAAAAAELPMHLQMRLLRK